MEGPNNLPITHPFSAVTTKCTLRNLSAHGKCCILVLVFFDIEFSARVRPPYSQYSTDLFVSPR